MDDETRGLNRELIDHDIAQELVEMFKHKYAIGDGQLSRLLATISCVVASQARTASVPEEQQAGIVQEFMEFTCLLHNEGWGTRPRRH